MCGYLRPPPPCFCVYTASFQYAPGGHFTWKLCVTAIFSIAQTGLTIRCNHISYISESIIDKVKVDYFLLKTNFRVVGVRVGVVIASARVTQSQ